MFEPFDEEKFKRDKEEYMQKISCGVDDNQVVKPQHYERWTIEPVTFIMTNDMEFWRGNVIKYVSRAGFKNNEVEDLRKAQRYLQMRINQLTGKEITDDGTR